MQRRAATAYLVLFLVVSAGAYAVIGVAEEPELELDGPTYTEGDELTVDERAYSVTEVALEEGDDGGHGGGGGGSHVGTLEWTDPDATESVTLDNNTNVSWQTVSWDGQTVESTTLEAESTVGYNGSFHSVGLNATAEPATVTLTETTDDSVNETFEVGDRISLSVDGQYLPGRTITEVTDSEATIAVGEDYLVEIASDNESATLTQQFNVTRRLMEVPTLDNGTFVNDAGVTVVRNKTTEQTSPLSEVLPDPEVKELEVDDTIRYEGNETSVDTISPEAVTLTRTVPATNTVDLEEGSGITLGPENREFLVHFPDDTSVQIIENTTSNWAAYQDEKSEIDNYHERMSGLWGVVILAFMGALILGAAAYLPVKD